MYISMYLIYILHYGQRLTSPQTCSERVRPARREPWLWQCPATQTQSPDQQVIQERSGRRPLQSHTDGLYLKIRDMRNSCLPYSLPLPEQGLAEQVLEHREGFLPVLPAPSQRALGKGCFPQLKSNQREKSIPSTSRCEREHIYLHHYFLFTICPVYIIKFPNKLVLN